MASYLGRYDAVGRKKALNLALRIPSRSAMVAGGPVDLNYLFRFDGYLHRTEMKARTELVAAVVCRRVRLPFNYSRDARVSRGGGLASWRGPDVVDRPSGRPLSVGDKQSFVVERRVGRRPRLNIAALTSAQ